MRCILHPILYIKLTLNMYMSSCEKLHVNTKLSNLQSLVLSNKCDQLIFSIYILVNIIKLH